jgi:NAD+ kinase
MKAGVISRTDRPYAIEVTRNLLEILHKKDIKVSVETDTALALELEDYNTDISELEGDFVVTIGGDGTILRTAMDMKNPDTPLLGINLGRRGFLSEIGVPEMEWAVNKILNADYEIEENMKVSSRCLELDDMFPDALNEVLIASSLPSKMLLMGLSVDGEHLLDVQADGAIVSTPAGSTAYNMSAGGSVITPSVNAMSLTAICPYSYFKSIVLPPDSTITIELLKPKADALVIIDGRTYTAIKPQSTVEVFLSPNKTRFIRFKPFYSRLRKRIVHLQSQ